MQRGVDTPAHDGGVHRTVGQNIWPACRRVCTIPPAYGRHAICAPGGDSELSRTRRTAASARSSSRGSRGAGCDASQVRTSAAARLARQVVVDVVVCLGLVDGRRYLRTVAPAGAAVVAHERYDVARSLAGQRVAVAVVTGERALVVHRAGGVVERVPLRGLRSERRPFARYCALMAQEARPRARRRPSLASVRPAA